VEALEFGTSLILVPFLCDLKNHGIISIVDGASNLALHLG
jgi:hypothetical protein